MVVYYTWNSSEDSLPCRHSPAKCKHDSAAPVSFEKSSYPSQDTQPLLYIRTGSAGCDVTERRARPFPYAAAKAAAAKAGLIGIRLAASDHSAGTSQAVLYQRLGFPYHEQWKRVPASTVDHGLPPNAQATPDLPTRDAVSRDELECGGLIEHDYN